MEVDRAGATIGSGPRMEELGTWRSPSGEVGTESMYGAMVLQSRLESMRNS